MVKIENLEESFSEILEEMGNLHVVKNNDYGNAFERSVEFSGVPHAVGIMYQKLCRIQELTSNPEKQKVKDESVQDTLIDLANYAVMTLQFIRKQNQK